MRLALSLLVATICHGILFGVGAAVLAHHPRGEPAVAQAVDVEIVAAKPDPIAPAVPAGAPLGDRPGVSTLRRSRTVRRAEQVATVGKPSAVVSPVVADPPPPSALAGRGPAGAPAPSHLLQSSGVVPTAKPRYRTNPTPEYPIASRRRREEGVVLLDVAVDMSGTPTAISINRSSGHPSLDRAALDAVRRWTFEPARASGTPVFSQVVVPVRFSLREGP